MIKLIIASAIFAIFFCYYLQKKMSRPGRTREEILKDINYE